jgi:hypothetical protein
MPLNRATNPLHLRQIHSHPDDQCLPLYLRVRILLVGARYIVPSFFPPRLRSYLALAKSCGSIVIPSVARNLLFPGFSTSAVRQRPRLAPAQITPLRAPPPAPQWPPA